MLVPRRHDAASSYRYGFNGKENDNEVMGEGNFEDYGMRMYNPRIGRFFNVDPVSKSYPMLTPYQFASNSPISGIDLDGLEYYYAADGSYLGQGKDKDSKEVRLAKLTGSSKDGKLNYVQAVDIIEKASKNWVVINSDHEQFQQLSSIGYNENLSNPDSQQATDNMVVNRIASKNKWYGLGFDEVVSKMAGVDGISTHESRLLASKQGDTWHAYSNFFKTALFDRNNNSGMKSANMGAIKASLGIDITGGATYEQGKDFFNNGLNPRTGRIWPANNDRLKQGFTWDFNSKLLKGDYNTTTIQPNKGTTSGGFKYMGTATYGGNIYLKNNPNPNESGCLKE